MRNIQPLSDSDIRFLNHLRGVDGIKYGKSYPSTPLVYPEKRDENSEAIVDNIPNVKLD